jgi:hypothetical protein
MRRWLLPWLGAALVGAATQLPVTPALAQSPPTGPDNSEKEGRTPVFQGLFAVVSIIVVMVIICMPSRKA